MEVEEKDEEDSDESVVSVPAAIKARPASVCDVASLLPHPKGLAAVLVRGDGGKAAGGGGGEYSFAKHPYCGVRYDTSLYYAMPKPSPTSGIKWASMWTYGVNSHANNGSESRVLAVQ